jgi:hypothetical protein
MAFCILETETELNVESWKSGRDGDGIECGKLEIRKGREERGGGSFS